MRFLSLHVLEFEDKTVNAHSYVSINYLRTKQLAVQILATRTAIQMMVEPIQSFEGLATLGAFNL